MTQLSQSCQITNAVASCNEMVCDAVPHDCLSSCLSVLLWFPVKYADHLLILATGDNLRLPCVGVSDVLADYRIGLTRVSQQCAWVFVGQLDRFPQRKQFHNGIDMRSRFLLLWLQGTFLSSQGQVATMDVIGRYNRMSLPDDSNVLTLVYIEGDLLVLILEVYICVCVRLK